MTLEQFSKIYSLCEHNYSINAWRHVTSVMEYVKQDLLYRFYPEETRRYLCALAIAHDAIEEKFCTITQLVTLGLYSRDIRALTRYDDESYEEYINNLFKNGSQCAILVKKADMRDHLIKKETLTPKLKEKYSSVAHYFCEQAGRFEV